MKDKIIATVLAHPDDETLGCGGTLARAIQSGSEVHCIIPVKRIEEQCIKALEILGVQNIHWGNFDDNSLDKYPLLDICKFVSKHINAIEPDIVFTHHWGCTNQDHRVCYEASIIALRQKDTALLTCEIPSSTGYLRPTAFEPNFWVKLSANLADKKIEALRCYTTEMELFPHPFSEMYIDSLMKIRGSEANTLWAEGFMLIRGLL